MGRYLFGSDGTIVVERRATPRYSVALSVEITTGAGGEPVRAMTINISESGVQLLAPNGFEPGRPLRFECELFAGKIEAIWSRTEGDDVRTGCKFVALDWRDRDALLDLISDLRSNASSTAIAAAM